MNLLLLSNSTNFGSVYLDHAMPAIRDFLGAARRVAFVPFALQNREGYVAKARERPGSHQPVPARPAEVHAEVEPQGEAEEVEPRSQVRGGGRDDHPDPGSPLDASGHGSGPGQKAEREAGRRVTPGG